MSLGKMPQQLTARPTLFFAVLRRTAFVRNVSSESSAMHPLDTVGDRLFKNVPKFPEQLRIKAALVQSGEKGFLQAYRLQRHDRTLPDGVLPGDNWRPRNSPTQLQAPSRRC